jgi:hypothetical protein
MIFSVSQGHFQPMQKPVKNLGKPHVVFVQLQSQGDVMARCVQVTPQAFVRDGSLDAG